MGTSRLFISYSVASCGNKLWTFFCSFCYIFWQGKLVIEVEERKISLINFLFLKSRLLPIDEETGQNTQTRHFPIDHFYNLQFITSRALRASFDVTLFELIKMTYLESYDILPVLMFHRSLPNPLCHKLWQLWQLWKIVWLTILSLSSENGRNLSYERRRKRSLENVWSRFRHLP